MLRSYISIGIYTYANHSFGSFSEVFPVPTPLRSAAERRKDGLVYIPTRLCKLKRKHIIFYGVRTTLQPSETKCLNDFE